MTNYFRIRVPQGDGLYQYHVEFNPPVESPKVRRALLYQESAKLGEAYIFDGMSDLKTLVEIEPHNTILSATRSFDNAVISIQLNNVGKAGFGTFEMIRFYNTQMRRNMIHLGMQQIGRNYYEKTPLGEVNYFGGVQVLQGFQTAINRHDAGLLLMVDNNCKFMRKQTALDALVELRSKSGPNFIAIARRELSGSIVMTKYNNKTYKVDDIDFHKNAGATFMRGDQEVSYADYYREQYNIEIRDLR